MEGAEPGGEADFVTLVRGQAYHLQDCVNLRSDHVIVVADQEGEATAPCRSLIAVVERVVLGKAEGIGGGKIEQIRLTAIRVSPLVLRAGEGALQEEFVPNAGCAAILPKRDIVQKKYNVALQEDRLAQSFASARNTPACSRSTLRAISSCRSSSGL